MGFSFRFETLLAYRGHRKEQAEAALGRERRRLNRAQDELEGLRNRRRQSGEELSASLRQRPTADLLRYHADFLSALKRRIEARKTDVAACEQAVRDRLNEVLARTREYRIMEKLKERDYEAWLLEQRHQEQKVLDENAVIRHGRVFP